MQWQLLRAAILRLIRLAAGFGLPDLRRHAYPQGMGCRETKYWSCPGPTASDSSMQRNASVVCTSQTKSHERHIFPELPRRGESL